MKKRTKILKAISMAFAMSGVLLCAGKTVRAAGDVSKDAWYYDAVNYVMDQKYMNGISAESFDPLSYVTRAQFVQVLYNIEGCPGIVDVNDGTFRNDPISSDQWYHDAVCWATDDGIAEGVAVGAFGQDNLITREQIAAMLYKYAIRSGAYKTTIEESALDGFEDKDKVSDWAIEALKWAVGNGIMNGKPSAKGKVLAPQENATRAECAQLVMNFKKNAGVEVPTYPEKYDLRNVIEIPVEDQGNFGLCWDFAAMKCLETNLALTKGLTYNFSEIHVGYMMSDVIAPYLSILDSYYLRTFDDGGNFQQWLDYNLAFHGFVAEADLEYRVYDAEEYRQFGEMELLPINVAKVKKFPIHNYDNLLGSNSEATVENVKRQVKEHIMKYGAIWVGVMVQGDETYLYEDEYGLNHAMAIIGWDDTIPKEKFAHEKTYYWDSEKKKMIQPKKDGGYIVLNSWGTEYGNQGIMYISYEDCNVHSNLWGIISADDVDLIDLNKESGVSLQEALQKKYPELVINKNGKKYLNPLQMEELKSIDLSGCGITSLEGIEELGFLANCSEIDLSDNEIADLTPLKSAELDNVWQLNLNNNKITDVSPLTSLENLSCLFLKDNQVKDVSPLKDCKTLSILHLDGNKNVAGYGELQSLNELQLNNCGLSQVEKVKVSFSLDLSGNPIADQMDSLEFGEIYSLRLRNCGLKKIPNIGNVQNLDLSGNPDINDFSALNKKNLSWLGLSDCNIIDGSVFPKEWTILELDLSGNVGIHNLEGLSKSVETIVLKNCGITDVSILGDGEWNTVDLSGNVGMYGELNAYNLIVENCGLDDQFDFFEDGILGTLHIKNNPISLKHILDSVNCTTIVCDPISVEEFFMIPVDFNTKIDVQADVYATMKIPASATEKTIQILPAIRHFLPNSGYGDVYVIEEGKDIDYDPYLLTGKMHGDHAQVKVDTRYFRTRESDYFPYEKNFTFILDIQVVDQLKPESITAHLDRIYEKYYVIGDQIDLSKVKVEKFYEGGYSEFVTDFEITGPENLEFGENKFLVKYDDFETEFSVDAGIKLYFETEEVYEALLENLASYAGLYDADEETKMLVLNEWGTEVMKTRLTAKIPSGKIWELEKLKGLVSIQQFHIQYDGHKIDEKDLEVLKGICDLGLWSYKPCLNIHFNAEQENKNIGQEDMIIEQDIFEVVLCPENSTTSINEENNASDENIPGLPKKVEEEALSTPEESESETLSTPEESESEALSMPEELESEVFSAAEDIFEMTEVVPEMIDPEEMQPETTVSEESSTEERNLEEIVK